MTEKAYTAEADRKKKLCFEFVLNSPKHSLIVQYTEEKKKKNEQRRRRRIFLYLFHLLCSISSQLLFVGNLMIFFFVPIRSILFTSSLFISVAADVVVSFFSVFVLHSFDFRFRLAEVQLPNVVSMKYLQRKLFASLWAKQRACQNFFFYSG